MTVKLGENNSRKSKTEEYKFLCSVPPTKIMREHSAWRSYLHDNISNIISWIDWNIAKLPESGWSALFNILSYFVVHFYRTEQHFTTHHSMGFTTGVFGSSPERVQWRLLRVMVSMWIIMIFNGILLNHFFGTPLWTLPELYFVGLIAFHSWHWASHQR